MCKLQATNRISKNICYIFISCTHGQCRIKGDVSMTEPNCRIFSISFYQHRNASPFHISTDWGSYAAASFASRLNRYWRTQTNSICMTKYDRLHETVIFFVIVVSNITYVRQLLFHNVNKMNTIETYCNR